MRIQGFTDSGWGLSTVQNWIRGVGCWPKPCPGMLTWGSNQLSSHRQLTASYHSISRVPEDILFTFIKLTHLKRQLLLGQTSSSMHWVTSVSSERDVRKLQVSKCFEYYSEWLHCTTEPVSTTPLSKVWKHIRFLKVQDQIRYSEFDVWNWPCSIHFRYEIFCFLLCRWISFQSFQLDVDKWFFHEGTGFHCQRHDLN